MKLAKYLGFLPLAICLFSCSDDDKATTDLSQVSSTPDFVDPRDGKSYKCIKVGNQVWMAENLAYFPDAGALDGCFTWNQNDVYDLSTLPLPRDVFDRLWKESAQDPSLTFSESIRTSLANRTTWIDSYGYTQDYLVTMTNRTAMYQPFVAIYLAKREAYINDNFSSFRDTFFEMTNKIDAANGDYSQTYGYLYSYEGAKKAVPAGWHLPTDQDWMKLEMALGISQEECGLINAWRGTTQGEFMKQTDAKGFGALFGGADCWCDGKGNHLWIKKDECAYFWTADKHMADLTVDGDESESTSQGQVEEGIIRQVAIYSSQIWRGTTRLSNTGRPVLYSVRCVKDN